MASASPVLSQSLRFAQGLRAFLHEPVTMDEARASVARWWKERDSRFLEMLDDLVWSAPTSPYLLLLQHAGVEPGDVKALVDDNGVEGALEHLRGAGVYVAYEEYLGKEPAVRGSKTFQFVPPDFANPTLVPDYMASSGGTRSGGTQSGSSFADRRAKAVTFVFCLDMFDVLAVPAASWMPALPAASGLGGVLMSAAGGQVTERWMSPIDPRAQQIPARKRVASWMLPVIARAYGGRLPRPRYVPTSDPATVLDWCKDALARGGRALLSSYPSSAVALAHHAVEEGVDLSGLVARCAGEPLTPARRAVIESSGATAFQVYAASPVGGVAFACPRCGGDEMHVMEQAVALVTRRRSRPDGVEVDALLCTTLDTTSGQVVLNLENDDYAELFDGGPCECALGRIGLRRKIRGVRGISKVVAGGVTVDGELLQHLVDVVLPQRFGGSPSDYQLAEGGADGQAELVLRAAPRLGSLDVDAVLAAVETELRSDELGLLAASVWSPSGALRVVREAPHVARSGKVMPFEPLA